MLSLNINSKSFFLALFPIDAGLSDPLTSASWIWRVLDLIYWCVLLSAFGNWALVTGLAFAFARLDVGISMIFIDCQTAYDISPLSKLAAALCDELFWNKRPFFHTGGYLGSQGLINNSVVVGSFRSQTVLILRKPALRWRIVCCNYCIVIFKQGWVLHITGLTADYSGCWCWANRAESVRNPFPLLLGLVFGGIDVIDRLIVERIIRNSSRS